MKATALVVVLSLLLIFTAGCATKCPVCPIQDAYTVNQAGQLTFLPMGALDTTDSYYTREELEALYEEYYKHMLEQSF